jgi:hypothetical protein
MSRSTHRAAFLPSRAKVEALLGADVRSLAAYRIVLALLALVDILSRAANLSAHYTDAGVLPRSARLEYLPSLWVFSLHLMSGDAFVQAALFVLAGVAALALLVGFRTRAMVVVSWVLLVSVQVRNPLVLSAADVLLRLLFFWGMFLPLGAYWSVDRLRAGSPRLASMRVFSFATVGLFAQIVFVYWFGALHKSGPEWRTDGTAIYYALSLDQLVTPLGAYLRQFGALLKVMTFGTFWFEALGPLLLFSPVFTGPLRTAGVLGFMSLHLGIWLSMDLGLFQWVAALAMVCFLPAWFWCRAAGLLRAIPPHRRVGGWRLGDPVARLARSYLGPLTACPPSWGVAQQTQPSVLPIGYAGEPSWRGVGWSRPHQAPPAGSAQDAADARHAPGVDGGAGEPIRLRSSAGTNLLAAFFLACAFCWNLSTVSGFQMPPPLEPVTVFLGLDQSWDMFSPYPSKEDGWFVIPGVLRGGTQLDLLPVIHGDFRIREGLNWEKPDLVSRTFDERGWRESWRKYLLRIWEKRYAEQRLYFGQYLCREWNERHDGAQRLERFQIYYMLEITQPDYRSVEPQKQLLWDHSC